MDKVVLRKWLKAGVVEKGKLFPTEQGTPQGGIISPTLANMVLDGLEERLAKTIRKKKKDGNVIFNPMINLVRYADDFIVTGCTPEVLEHAKNVISEFLQERGLSLSEEKTKIVHIETGFDFLGQNVRMYGGKLLIKPSKDAAKKVLKKIRMTIQANKAVNQEILIGLLNPIITPLLVRHSAVSITKSGRRYGIGRSEGTEIKACAGCENAISTPSIGALGHSPAI
jgi:RNA-directed DNA polymerase